MNRPHLAVTQLEGRLTPARIDIGLSIGMNLIVQPTGPVSPPVSPPPAPPGGGGVVVLPPPPVSPPITGT